ncbi:MAG: nitrogenase molybdenum-cofactor biosynthesis protein NifE [Campylobacteraceae bacterium]|jgi:nitrogenase molybdenum-cofactor synthesis protein NifE|nr:nitrogenase molybdenum-cofactor biosynthesis protein NifE [Campylobacteraceae bacterium]
MVVSRELIKELLSESDCSHNSVKKSSCDKPKPGSTSGGCAYEGAQISLFPYADTVHLVHGPHTCLGASWETRASMTSFEGENNIQLGYCTNITAQDIIFGGDKKLSEAIEYVISKKSPQAVFVYETCVTAMIGDNIDHICKESWERFGIPVVPIHAPGFAGGKNLGSRLASESILNFLIGTKEPETIHAFGVNLIGDYNVTGDMWQYKSILEKIGIKVISTLSGDGRIDEICQAHRAKLNVIVCAKSLITLCRKMRKRYGIPYVSVSFYGKRDTSSAILSIANALGSKKMIQKAKAVIQEEEEKLDKKLEPYKKILEGKKAILNTGGNKSWSIASALQDIGLNVVATSINKSTEEDIAMAKKYVDIVFKNPTADQPKLIDEHGIHILLAGGRSLYTAIKKKIAFADVNQEKKRSYGAYNGLINLAEDVCAALSNPVFKLVGKKAPWES